MDRMIDVMTKVLAHGVRSSKAPGSDSSFVYDPEESAGLIIQDDSFMNPYASC